MKPGIVLESQNPQISFTHYLFKTLIGSDGRSGTLEMAFKVFSEVQAIGMLVNFSFNVLSATDVDALGLFVQKIAKYVSFDHLFTFDNTSAINNVLYGFFLAYMIFMLAIAGLLMNSYYTRSRNNTYLISIWKNLGIIHYTTVFLFIYQFMLLLVNSESDTTFYLWVPNFPLPFFILAFLIIVVAAVFAAFFCKFLYEPLRTNYLLASRTSTADLLLLLYKVIDPPLDLFLTDLSVRRWLRAALIIVIFAGRLKVFIFEAPYFYKTPMKLFWRFAFVQFALSLVNLVMLIIGVSKSNTQNYEVVYMGIVITAFFPKISDAILHHKIKYYSSKDHDTIKNANGFHWRLFALEVVATDGAVSSKAQKRSRDNDYEFMLYGVVSTHKKRCNKSGCACKLILRANDLNPPKDKNTTNFVKEKEMFQGLKFELIKELYREGAKRLPFDTEIKIGLANLIFENKFRSYAPSISLIHTMNLTEQSSIKRVIAVALLEKIEKKLISDYDNSVNIKEIVDFQSASQRLRALIESNIVKFLSFWETYKSPDPSVVKLYDCSTLLNKEADEITSTWNMIISKYKRLAYSDHLIYGLYLSLVRSAPYSAEKALQTYFSYIKSYDPEKNREYQLTPENVHEAKNILVCISMKREKLGTVTFITSNVEEVLNYKQFEIVGKDVNVMMPGFYQERHKRILLAHVENSRTSIFNRNRPVFIRNKAGYIIPCNIYVTMFPYFQGQLLYLGVLRPTNIYDDFILVLSDGTIDCFTENVGKVLGLTSSHRRYNLIDISRELSKLHKALLPLGASTELKWKSSFTKKRTKDGYVDSSYSMKSGKSMKSQATYRVGQSDVVKDKEEEEDDSKSSKSTARMNSVDLTKTYELFTTTGVTVGFYKVNSVKGESTRFEYNTILTEEHILGSHLRIFRLQTSSEGEDIVQNNTAANSRRDVMETFNDDAFAASLDKKRTQQSRLPTEQSIRMTCPEDAGIGAKAEDEVQFKNPFYKKVTIDEGSTRIEPFNIVKNNDSDQLKNSETRAGDSTPVTNNNRSISLGIKKETTTSRGKTNPAEENSELQQVAEKDKKLEKGQLKKFLKENQIIIGEDGADKNSVTSQTRADKINSKLERAIYLNETEFSIFILTWAIVCFCGLSVGMVIYFHIVTQSYLGHVNVNMNVFETLYERANQVVEIDRKARMIYIFQEGLAPVARHTTDDEVAEQTALQSNAVGLSTQNNDLRTAYHSIHASTQDLFYQTIDVYSKEEPDKIRSMNTFDLCTEISASALELYDLQPTKPDANNSDLGYILNNSLRGMLQVNEDIATVLEDLNDDSIQSIENTIISIIIIRISCGLMIFVFVIKIEASFLKMRSRFLEAFLTIKDHEVEQSVYIVNTFLVYLKENRKGDYFVDKITNSKAMSQAKLANHKKLQHKGFKAKKATLHGMNVPVFFNFLFTSICLSVFVILLSILLRIFAIYRGSIDDTRENLVSAKVNLYKFGLVFTSLYEYISENGQTMVGDMVISDELEINYDYLSAANNGMATFIHSGKAYNNEISYLLTGDLCAELFAGQACYNVSSGVVSKGLLAMNDYMLQAIQTVKNFYDSSSKTTDAEILVAQQQALVLKDLIAAEDLFNNFIITTYGELNKALRSQYRTIANNFSVTNLAFLIFAVVTCLSLTKFLFMLVRTRMENERKGYKNFMRIIPITIIMNNRFLKNYLLTNSKRLLESVKNRI